MRLEHRLERLAPRAQRSAGTGSAARPRSPRSARSTGSPSGSPTSTGPVSGTRRQVQVEGPGEQWVDRRLPIRYDPCHPSQVDLVNIAEARPARQRARRGRGDRDGPRRADPRVRHLAPAARARASPSHPFTVLRVPLAIAGSVLALGIAAWAVGTVSLRGWSGVADRLGKQFSVVFGDMLGVTVPARHVRDRLPAHRVARPPPSPREPRRACCRSVHRHHRPRRRLRPVAGGAPGGAARADRDRSRAGGRAQLGPPSAGSPTTAGDQNRAMTSSAKRASESSCTCRSFGSPP